MDKDLDKDKVNNKENVKDKDKSKNKDKDIDKINAKKNKTKKLIYGIITAVITVLLSIIILGLISPIYFVFIRSFSPAEDMFPISLFPSEPVLRHFSDLVRITGETGIPFSRNIFSSLVISVITTAVQIPVVCAMAYVLTKIDAPGVRMFDRIIEHTIILSPLVLYVPQFFLMLKLGISDSYFAMILPFVASPFSVWLVKQYMNAAFPTEIVYSAIIDGASHFRICFGIVMPNIKPAIFAVMVLSFGNMWSYTGELFAHSADIMPIGSLMPHFAQREEIAGVFYAAAAVIAVPMTILAIVFQKDIARTAAVAGIKTNTRKGVCGKKDRVYPKKAKTETK
ncbi:MAG: carbohydrate ABC transporter permease [Oscillospiraceae bacterium]|nr:carbohydrate ABC transporter permease [Oscillospiraceae bacterium]